MSRIDSRIIKNFIYNGSFQVFKIIVPLILTPYVSRTLGPEGNGLYSYVNSIVSYFILFGNLGLETYAQLVLSKERKDTDKQAKIFWEIFELRALLFFFAIACYSFLVIKVENNRLIYSLMGLLLVNQLLSSGYLFQANENIKSITIRNYLVKLASLVLILFIVKQENDLWKYVLILNLSETLGNLWMLITVCKQIGYPEKLYIFRGVYHLRKSMAYFVPAIASTIMVYIDKVMLGTMLNDNYQNGIYSQPEKIYQLILTIVSAMIIVVRPRLSYAWNEGDMKQFVEGLRITFQINAMLILPISIGLIITSSFFTTWFFGEEYVDSISVVNVFCCVVIIRAVSLCLFEVLMIQGRMKKYDIVLFGGMFANLISNLVMIPRLQAIGAAYATLITEFIMLIALVLFNIETIKMGTILFYAYKYILAAMIMSFICTLFIAFFGIDNMAKFISVVLVGVLSYVISLIVIKDEILFTEIKNIFGGRK